MGRVTFARTFAVMSAIGVAILLLSAGLAAADTHAWTTQADFQTGTLNGLNATSPLGTLTLQDNATAFTPYTGNPVFAPDPGNWDSSGVVPYSVLRIADSWVMWYTGVNSSGVGIGRAVSADGVHWTRNPSIPLLTAADWPIVLYESGTYKMWYEHVPGAYMQTAAYYATSADGIHWTPYAGNPVLAPSPSGFDSFSVTPGGVVHDASGYRMWYSGADGSSLTYAVGLATSPDGITWTRYSGNPIITPPFGGWWDSERVLPCLVIPWEGKLLMGYVGTDSSFVQRIALATSVDGIHWTPFPGPTLDVGSPGSWDGAGLSRFALYPMGGNLTMWYGGLPASGVFETGIAYAPSYVTVGTFVSAVLDSGSPSTTWKDISWVGSTPPGTAIAVSLEVGNTSEPDPTWTLSPPSDNTSVPLHLPMARYARLLVALASISPSRTPVLDSASVTYQLPAPTQFGGLGFVGLVALLALVAVVAAALGVLFFLARRSARAQYASTQGPGWVQCPQCGAPMPAANRFCSQCGTGLGASGQSVPLKR